MANGKQKAIGTMTVRYILVLGMLATLALINYFILEEKIRAHHASAQVLQTSSRQKFLLLHSAAMAQRLASSAGTPAEDQLRKDLQQTIDLMEVSHRNLVDGNESLGLPGRRRPGCRACISPARRVSIARRTNTSRTSRLSPTCRPTSSRPTIRCCSPFLKPRWTAGSRPRWTAPSTTTSRSRRGS